MKTYSETITYLYAQLPMFSREGQSAFKKDLDRTLALCEALGNPQNKLKTIHVAGTNGKGSSSHMLAALLAENGYKTGLYTSPHLLDFRERIRVNGEMASEEYVVSFVAKHKALIEKIHPSFFEVTVAMAFDYFAQQSVDIAVVETGLGGRLDSTNIIRPLVSLITNISFDHSDILGGTLPLIAREKAGIIKENTPIVISERNPETDAVFEEIASNEKAPLTFAQDIFEVLLWKQEANYLHLQMKDKAKNIETVVNLDLRGLYQKENIKGVLAVVEVLKRLGIKLEEEKNRFALQHVGLLTGMQGRWQTLSMNPLIVADAGHNVHGVAYLEDNLRQFQTKELHIVWGMMKDKDISSLLELLPKEAKYYFCEVDLPRALSSEELRLKAKEYDLEGASFGSVESALRAAIEEYTEGDLIFVGGSTFVVADSLAVKI